VVLALGCGVVVLGLQGGPELDAGRKKVQFSQMASRRHLVARHDVWVFFSTDVDRT
jgi:hypothetical protein